MIRCSLLAKTRSSTGRDVLLGRREARDLGVGGVGEEQVDALVAEAGELVEVGDPAVERELVHLEVAGVQHDAGTGADDHREGVGDGVVDRDELEHERPEGDRLALRDLVLRGLLEPVLAQLGAEQRQGQLGADERDVAALAQEVRRRADVVLVAVGQHQRLDGVEAVPDRVEVGQDQVDAGVVVLGEEHAAVDDQQAAVVLEDGHVATDLAQPAERDDPQASGREGGGRAQVGVGMAQGFPSFVRRVGSHRRPAAASPARSAVTSSSSRATSGPRTRRLSSTPSSSRAALAVVAP